jgi:hypothetical protein
LNKIALAGPVWLASDVHLGQNTFQTSEAFREFLKLASKEAAGLLLQCDIFERKSWPVEQFHQVMACFERNYGHNVRVAERGIRGIAESLHCGVINIRSDIRHKYRCSKFRI